jgi:hypothetical protein
MLSPHPLHRFDAPPARAGASEVLLFGQGLADPAIVGGQKSAIPPFAAGK